MTRSGRALVFSVAVFALAHPAASQNLLQNATFDTSVAPWSFGTFSSMDALGDSSSGSVAKTNTVMNTVVDVLSECIPITAGKTYDTRADYRLTPTSPVGAASIQIAWFESPTCAAPWRFLNEVQGTVRDGNWHSISESVTYPAGARSSIVMLRVWPQAAGTFVANFDNVVLKPRGTCASLPTVLCLNGDRFQIEAQWSTSSQSGSARGVKLTNDSGYLWFFSSQNVEVVLKVLDACSFNNRFWFFSGGLTDQGVDITVTDMKTAATRTYKNIRGAPFQPIQDTSAFATCP